MNNRQKEVQQSLLNEEKKIIKNIKGIYNKALEDIDTKIADLMGRQDKENLQSIIYQVDYQKSLKTQINAILDTMNTEQFENISDYLTKCYDEGFIGNMYDLHGQGIPLIFPIDQEQVVEAIKLDSKINKGLYQRLGEDVGLLKKRIANNVSRGISQGSSYSEIARNIKGNSNITMNQALRIARTEGHRISQKATINAQNKAKEKGADIVKQWDSTIDSRTRSSHQRVDGEIKEIDENFSNGLSYPGDPSGTASEVVNCRCVLLQRAKWGLDDEELKVLKERAEYFEIDKADSFKDFKSKYLKISEKYDIINIEDNKLYPNEIAGVKRGKEMTFEEADNGNVNPDYGKEYGYSINCQSCVVAFEARLRGYNVKVLPNTKGSMLEQLSRKTNMAWIDPATGKAPKYIKDELLRTPKKYLSFIKEIVKQGERYTIEFEWKGRSRSGHIVNLDRNNSGELRIKDNQRGLKEKSEWIGDSEILTYLSRIKYEATSYGYKYPTVPELLRIDNMEFNLDVINKIMKGVK